MTAGCGSGGSASGSGGASARSVTLTWDAPTTNKDDTPLTDLSGYKVYYGMSPRSYSAPVNVGDVTSSLVTGLTPETTYYFAVTAYDRSGNESAYSNEVEKDVL